MGNVGQSESMQCFLWPAQKNCDALIIGSAKLMGSLSIHFLLSKYLGFQDEEASNPIVLCGGS